MMRSYLLIAGLVAAFSSHAAVEYIVEEAEFTIGERRSLWVSADSPKSPVLMLTCQPSMELSVQFYSEDTIFPDLASGGEMLVHITHRFDKDKPIHSAWLMSTAQYDAALYRGDSRGFAKHIQASDNLSVRFDISGDAYRYTLRNTSEHVAKILEACPEP